MNKYKINFLGRHSGHEGKIAFITGKEPKIGEDYGLANKIVYQAHGMDNLKMVKIHYEDGCEFGPFLAGVVKKDGGYIFSHLSQNPTHVFDVYCTKQ